MSRQQRTRSPRGLIMVAVVGVAFAVIPIVGLVAATPWADLPSLFADDVVLDALRISLVASLTATALSLFLGFPLAYLFARVAFPGKAVVRGIVLLPLVLPPVVGGAALLFGLGRTGVFGAPLYEATGLVLPFSIWGVIIASTFVAMPFLVLTVEGGLRSMDRRYEGAAAGLGATPWRVLWRITVPMIRPAIVAGTVLAWARAFGEFGATITFAGSLQGRTQTMPLAVFVALESNRSIAIAISLVMVVVAIAVLVGLRDRWWTS